MREVPWMVAAALTSGILAAAIAGRPVAAEILAGMLAPLAAVTVSWVLTERTYQREPAQVTRLMMTLFGVKMLFFGAYLAVMIKVVGLAVTPFAVSFTGYFVALYLTEALLMRRLFARSG